MEITRYTDLADLELVAAWDALESAGACPSLFATRTWVTAWAGHFAGGASPDILVGREGGEPAGLAPFFIEGRLASFPVNFLSPRGEFSVRAGSSRAFASALLSHLRERQLTLRLRGVPFDSATMGGLTAASREAGYLDSTRPSRVSPFVDTTGSWEEYYAGRGRKVTHEWERKMRKLEAAGAVRVLSLGPGMDAERLVDDFTEVERRSWKETAGTSIPGRGVERFYRDVARVLASCGRFLPFWLELDGEVFAFLFGAVHDNVYHAMKTSFDEASSHLSPGTTLFHEAVRRAFGAGIARFDFLGERARWKDEWATGWREHADVRLFTNTVSGRVAHLIESSVRPVARSLRGVRRGTLRSARGSRD